MKTDEKVYDVTIIGGGPVGLFTAFYAGMRNLSVKIIESLPQLGGRLSVIYPEKFIYDVAGFPKVRAKELIDNLIEQLGLFEQTFVMEQTIQSYERVDSGVMKVMTDKEIHMTKTIIIAAGLGAFQPRKLAIENAVSYEGKTLHYFINDMSLFKGKKVIVLGGGDSAVDWTLMLEPIAESVTIVHRRDKFTAHEHSVEQLKKSSVEIKTPFVPTELEGDDGKLQKITFKNGESGGSEKLEADELFVNYGFTSSLGALNNWGLDMSKISINVNSKMETNLEGIYAVGDVCDYEGKVKLIATGFGEATIAINAAKHYIDPTARGHVPHSSDMFNKK
ncbi:NAD(P)/FAD-dependent oxidoreductase [Lysinibacillus sp. SGAir0095]|uniref:NAD(P)/FAD-dependent oxidoreductase n=1 Tax=Lysinibacillus sp. SGAir0095 TaxID=2070463 RepID=UPI0010CCE8F7|nr:NAD(P)/FAD-dependent oxidoreductase [Lysinibacillus sp. SGAir0095]QCR31247.1 ferredoxin--NADP(+) reductase [Lysinibacillus sp. SGAir0095]